MRSSFTKTAILTVSAILNQQKLAMAADLNEVETPSSVDSAPGDMMLAQVGAEGDGDHDLDLKALDAHTDDVKVSGDDIDVGVQNFFINISNPFSKSPSVSVGKAHDDDDHHDEHKDEDHVHLHNPADLKPVPKHLHLMPEHKAPSYFNPDEDRSDWYTNYQKYRAPMVPYKPF